MEKGTILLVSCYELGHQPLALASPLAFLERAGSCRRGARHLRRAVRPGKVCPGQLRGDLRAHAHRASPGSPRGGADPSRESRLPHLLLRPLRLAERRLPARALGRFGDRGRVRVGAGHGGGGGGVGTPGPSRGSALARTFRQARPPAPGLRPAGPGRPARTEEVRASGQGRRGRSWSAMWKRAAAACTCACTVRSRPSMAAASSWCRRHRPRRHPAARARGRDPHHLRRSGFPEWTGPLAGRGARHARRASLADLRLHRQDRAHPGARGDVPRAAPARLRVHGLGGGIAQPDRARQPGEGAHAGGRGARAGDRAGGRHRLPPHVGRLHPVDDARGLSRDVRVRGDPKG